MNKEHIGTCIRMAMAKKGLMSKELSILIGRSVTSIVAYRIGECPDELVKKAIAEACDMTLEEMMNLNN